MTNEMIKKFEDAGAKRWQKGNMDRLYFNIDKLIEMGEKCGVSFTPSRQCKQFAKVYVDVATGELVMDRLGLDNEKLVSEIIKVAIV